MRKLTIAIDGPSGAGKSTVARRAAAALGYSYIDTGAMYRAVALKSLQAGVPVEQVEAITHLAESIRIQFEPDPAGAQRVLVDDFDVTAAIRTPEVTRLSSPVSAISGVRRILVAQQQAMGRAGGVVMEGRDIGTVVFPDAEVKVFLTASEEERARRRWRERIQRGESVQFEQILAQERERDTRDSSRADSPLRPAEDSVLLNSDGLTIDEVVQHILAIVKERANETG